MEANDLLIAVQRRAQNPNTRVAMGGPSNPAK
jgi:hypothetical protein